MWGGGSCGGVEWGGGGGGGFPWGGGGGVLLLPTPPHPKVLTSPFEIKQTQIHSFVPFKKRMK